MLHKQTKTTEVRFGVFPRQNYCERNQRAARGIPNSFGNINLTSSEMITLSLRVIIEGVVSSKMDTLTCGLIYFRGSLRRRKTSHVFVVIGGGGVKEYQLRNLRWEGRRRVVTSLTTLRGLLMRAHL